MSSKKTRFIPIDVQGQSKSRERKKEDEKDTMERPPFCEIIFEEKHRVVIDDLDCVQKLKTLGLLNYNIHLNKSLKKSKNKDSSTISGHFE